MIPQLPFIYSNQPGWRLLRHASFWILWFGFQLLLYAFSPSPVLQKHSFFNRLVITFPETIVFMLPSIFLAYVLMYFVITKLVLQGKYYLAVLSTLTAICLTAAFSALLSVYVVDHLRHLNADNVSKQIAREPHPDRYVQFGLAMLAGFRGSITVGGVAAALKLLKCYFEKQRSALLLEKEKVNAELQNLKAQLHPHFLFNTLNNIYSFTQDVSEKASGMILGLSHLLRYMLYDCNKPLVPLDKDIEMLKAYLALEAIRYDQGLEMTVQLPATSNFHIAPLMLLPFVENAFKHGVSHMTEKPWLSLDVQLKNEELFMKLINGKPAIVSQVPAGLGIINVRKRLELLYPGKHSLVINDEHEMYIVNLKLSLVPGPADLVKPVNNTAFEKI